MHGATAFSDIKTQRALARGYMEGTQQVQHKQVLARIFGHGIWAVP